MSFRSSSRHFTRGSAAKTSRSPGVGLGLTVSRRIAQAMKGDLTVRSNDAVTEFTFRVPFRLAERPAPLTAKDSHPTG